MKITAYDHHSQTITIKKGKELLKYTIRHLHLAYNSTYISCGINQIYGINDFALSIQNFCDNAKLPKKLYKDVFKAAFIGFIKYSRYTDNYDGAMWIASTNITDNKQKNLIEKSLGDICSIKSRVRQNPNSINKIRMWVIPNTNL